MKLRMPLSAIFVIAGLLLAIGARGNSSVFEKCISDQETSQTTAKKVEGSPNVGMSFLQREPIAFVCTGAFIDQNNPVISAIATVVVAIFTVVLSHVTNRQAKLTKEALIADKSCFVYPTGFHQDFVIDNNSGHYTWRFKPTWKNSGDTPAKQVRVEAVCDIRNTAFPIGHAFNYTAGAQQKGFIGPNDIVVGGLAPRIDQAAVTPQDIIDAQNGRKFIYLYGWTRYRDIFPETRSHITKFCWLINIQGDPLLFQPHTPGPPGTPGTLVFSWVQHAEGNTTEDE